MDFKQSSAKAKSLAVIQTCYTAEQLTTASRYILRYKDMFNDDGGYGELLSELKDRRKKLFYPNNKVAID